MENTEKKKGLLVLVIFLILVVVCLSGYIIYDKVFDKEKGVEPKNDGKVYSIYYDIVSKKFSQSEVTSFKNYKVDDIIEYYEGSACTFGQDCSGKFKIKTIDGKIIEESIPSEY